jgi:hypothetical protein
LSIGLEPGVLPVPVVARETLGRTMTPGLSSGEASKNDGTTDDWTLCVDDPDTGFVSRS